MSTKISELPVATDAAGNSVLVIVTNPANTAIAQTEQISVSDFSDSVLSDGDVHRRFFLSANGADSYVFGDGSSGFYANTENPTLYMSRGFSYRFINADFAEHPLVISTAPSGAGFSNGVTISGGNTTFEVPMDVSPTTLVYYCINHPGSMTGSIIIV